ncbi:MAG: ABC transporter ATP-binding protein [Coriobacteriia bacterium]|nr:ABC transporter ATP-binding protein [Coriobacteriia bacterium]
MLKLLIRYLKPYWKALILVGVLQLGQSVANLYLPRLNADIINNGVMAGDTDYILRRGGLMLLVTLIQAVGTVVAVYFGSRTAMAFGRDMRSALFRKVESFSQKEVNLFGTATLITRNTNDIQQIQMVIVLMLNMLIAAPMMAVGGVIMALREDVPLSTIIVVVVPLLAIVVGTMLVKALPLFRSMQKKIDEVNKVMREKLAGIRVIRAFVRTDYEARRFDVANLDLTDTSLKVNRIMAVMMPTLMLIFNVSTVAIMWFGGLRIDSGAMPIGNLTAFLSYVMQILMSVMMATIMFVMIPRAAASADRVQEVLLTEPSVIDPITPAEETGSRGYLEFDDVRFGYPGAEDLVLRGISFSASPGETLAIVGSTGSGKTTLVNLIPRFYDVTGGTIRVDGVDVRDMNRDRLWGKIGFIPQKAFLFSGTIGSNIRYGQPDATDEEVWHALEVAQAKTFVTETEGELEAPITQGGTNVSGGQRQRLAIARALVKKPEIYVFDDSFSALDFRTDSMLRAALKHETHDATVIIVAQRVSTIMTADRIVVLDKGCIAGMGTHKELMECCETYREIVYSQLSEEEVA